MIYPDGDAYLAAPRKAVALFGMSGLGKTTVAQRLRETGDWFHYSVDYRIGTRYMDEHIADNFKRAAMLVPFLRELLLSDSIHITSNMTFENLTPLSTYLGKPGDPAKDRRRVAWRPRIDNDPAARARDEVCAAQTGYHAVHARWRRHACVRWHS